MHDNLPFAEKALAILRDYVDRQHGGNASAASLALGIDPSTSTFHRWLRTGTKMQSARYPGLERLGPVLDKIGARLLGPDEALLPATPGDAAELRALKEEVASLRRRLEEMRRERDEARGAAAVLERLLEKRMAEKGEGDTPAPSYRSRQGSQG